MTADGRKIRQNNTYPRDADKQSQNKGSSVSHEGLIIGVNHPDIDRTILKQAGLVRKSKPSEKGVWRFLFSEKTAALRHEAANCDSVNSWQV